MFKKIRNISIVVIAVVLILFIAVVPAKKGLFQSAPQQVTYQELDVKTFKEKYEQSNNGMLLDVRAPEEFNERKIEGAVLLDFYRKDFYQQLDSLDKGKEYYVYCHSGGRSAKTCEYLTKKGYTCYNLKGGIEAWDQAK